MPTSDRIGNHGEFLFQVLISRMCRGRFYFHPIHMGEKHPTTDMMVELLDTTGVRSLFYVQAKATTLGYVGSGAGRRLRIDVSSSDVDKLKCYPGPTFVAGIDIVASRGYLAGIVAGTNGPIVGLSTRHPIDCRNIRALWAEVDAYWNSNARPIPMTATKFVL